MFISVNQNAERARTVREKERGRSLIALFYLLTSFFLFFILLNFIRETFLCSLNLFSCAQPILIAWTSCLKLFFSKIYLLWLLLPKQPRVAKGKHFYLRCTHIE